jgi:hypothetical protein
MTSLDQASIADLSARFSELLSPSNALRVALSSLLARSSVLSVGNR